MKFVIIGGTDSEKVLKGLVEYAEKPENRFAPQNGVWPLDGTPFRRIVDLEDAVLGEKTRYGIVFTITVALEPENLLMRHATITELDKNGVAVPPDPIAVFTICKFLGFEGTLDDWQIDSHPGNPDVAVVIAPYEKAA